MIKRVFLVSAYVAPPWKAVGDSVVEQLNCIMNAFTAGLIVVSIYGQRGSI